MRQYNVLVVDDEPEARKSLVQSLKLDPEIDLQGTCSNGLEAIEVINTDPVDIVLLDIQMPEINGFEVLANIDEHRMPRVIFITAYDKFAVKAFEFHALDYLLKPYKEERLFKALEYAKDSIGEKNSENSKFIQKLANQFITNKKTDLNSLIWNRDQKLGYNQRIAIKSNGILHFFSLSEVIYFKGYDAYVKIHLENERLFLVNNRMKLIESICDSRHFIRTHKSYIINSEFIESIHPGTNGDFTVMMQNGTELKGSRNYRKSLDSFVLKK
ncbi:MAG: LytTR family DNA-binding domain-containing protein [Cyclobacteriaceae bacterium]